MSETERKRTDFVVVVVINLVGNSELMRDGDLFIF